MKVSLGLPRMNVIVVALVLPEPLIKRFRVSKTISSGGIESFCNSVEIVSTECCGFHTFSADVNTLYDALGDSRESEWARTIR
jgi:hypothetical protein